MVRFWLAHHLYLGEFIYQESKTSTGRRTIALSPTSCLELQARGEKQERDIEALVIALTDETLVFRHPDGTLRVPSTLTLVFRHLTKRIG